MRILLANFHECPENLHFEQAFIRALNGAKSASLDIVHDFRFPYSFIKKLPPPGGRRVRYSTLAGLKRELRGPYDMLVVLDFPKRQACAAPFLRLLGDPSRAKKIFIANHLLPMPGHNPIADIAGKLGLLKVLDLAFILEFDDPGLRAGLGFMNGRILERGFAVDCLYYRPPESVPPSFAPGLSPGASKRRGPAKLSVSGADRPGNRVFSAGSAGRDFSGLARAVKKAGLALNIFSDAAVPPFAADLRTSVSVSPLSGNLHNLRRAVREAGAVVIPIAGDYVNETAGNSIVFIAMACGRPVIVRRTRYMERFIKDGKNGFFYDSLSAPDLFRQLKRALSPGPAASRRLAEAARATVLEKASLDVFTEAFAGKFVLKK